MSLTGYRIAKREWRAMRHPAGIQRGYGLTGRHFITRRTLRNRATPEIRSSHRLCLRRIGLQLLRDLDETLDRGDVLLELRALLGVQLHLDDPLDPLGADDHRHAHVEALHAVLAGKVGRTGQHALLVLEVGLGHSDGRGGGGIECRADAQQLDHLAPARTEEGRVGKEWVSTVSIWGSGLP